MALKTGCGIIYVFVFFKIILAFSEQLTDDSRLDRRKRAIEWGPDIAGPFCAKRAPQCCPDRLDECSVPVMDTFCYCDEFCDRDRSDCCPDFQSVCRRRPVTPSPIRAHCEYNGRYFQQNDQVKINCNLCRCVSDIRSASGYSFQCENNVCLIQENVINTINKNSNRYGWQASNYSQFWGLTLEEGRRYRLGTNKPDELVMKMSNLEVLNEESLPREFDSRKKWPGWVHGIRDQGNCAASWAFSTTALAADRLSIESRGAMLLNLSPQNLLSCSLNNQEGCLGGSLDRAWWFLRHRGVTTEACYPYTSGATGNNGTCLARDLQRDRLCPAGRQSREKLIYQATPPYRISSSEKDIMSEIQMNGPVQATFRVQDDFFMYRSGVYKYSRTGSVSASREDDRRLNHSVRIIGWGEEVIGQRLVKYWLCANSWGTAWGEGGYFRIERGSNECEIESFVLGVWGKVEADMELRELLNLFRAERVRVSTEQGRSRGRRHLRRHRRRRNNHKKQK
ncbi:tubulointerstitial nephritis antigen-like [Dreissena polymorpha]|uniref:tubulointerstitial nephritis antigen-like n=1 Tax=Dreissena polymorpha TaxID=45954 RepID=UPI00226506E8|nr:tubulointerstitial nephritis antigen-like [Dreissena polymorpha]